jgi:ribonuclease Z
MFRVGILGVSAALPSFGRNPSGQVIKYDGVQFLVDCGEGTQMQIQKYHVRLSKLDAIFISHFHGDHILGLPGMLNTLSMQDRVAPLKIISPKGLQDFIQHFFTLSDSRIKYPIEFIEVTTDEKVLVWENEKIAVYAFPLKHRIETYGYLFAEKARRPRFLIEKARDLAIPKEFFATLKNGEDVIWEDQKYLAQDFLGEIPASHSYAYVSDTMYDPAIVRFIENVSIIYHETTFLHAEIEKANETHHSTAKQAAEIAKLCKASGLIIGHYSARYSDLSLFLEETRAIFPNTELGLDGRFFDIPFNHS